MSPTKAYNELITTILSEQDQFAFEWAIGAMLANGTPNVVVISGGAGTGKSTLMAIVRKVLGIYVAEVAPRVAFINWDHRHALQPATDTFVFSESNEPQEINGDSIVIHTSGHILPVNKHYVLMHDIAEESVSIAKHCINLYSHFGDDYYNAVQENNL
jgi:hypothetical protein